MKWRKYWDFEILMYSNVDWTHCIEFNTDIFVKEPSKKDMDGCRSLLCVVSYRTLPSRYLKCDKLWFFSLVWWVIGRLFKNSELFVCFIYRLSQDITVARSPACTLGTKSSPGQRTGIIRLNSLSWLAGRFEIHFYDWPLAKCLMVALIKMKMCHPPCAMNFHISGMYVTNHFWLDALVNLDISFRLGKTN